MANTLPYAHNHITVLDSEAMVYFLAVIACILIIPRYYGWIDSLQKGEIVVVEIPAILNT